MLRGRPAEDICTLRAAPAAGHLSGMDRWNGWMTRNAVRATIRGVGAWSNAVRLRCPYTWPALQGIDSWGDAKSVLPQPVLSYKTRHFTCLGRFPKYALMSWGCMLCSRGVTREHEPRMDGYAGNAQVCWPPCVPAFWSFEFSLWTPWSRSPAVAEQVARLGNL